MEIMHNHKDDKYIYQYPLIQYNIIGNKPLVLGIEEGAEVLQNILPIDDVIIIEDRVLISKKREIQITYEDFGVTDNLITYRFLTPWMALNEENVKRYREGDIIEREEILKKIFIGNILSISKGLKYTVEDEIRVKLNVKEKRVNFKDNKMICFTGECLTNFKIPDYIGIGKSVSRGFGTIKATKKLP